MLRERLFKLFDQELEVIKKKRRDVYDGMINHYKKEFFKNYFSDEIEKLISKRAMKGDFDTSDAKLTKYMKDCIDFYVAIFINEKEKQNESPIAKAMREEMYRKHRMFELAQQGEFTDELAEIKDFVITKDVEHGKDRETDKV